VASTADSLHLVLALGWWIWGHWRLIAWRPSNIMRCSFWSFLSFGRYVTCAIVVLCRSAVVDGLSCILSVLARMAWWFAQGGAGGGPRRCWGFGRLKARA
jgi:hypothetical protein